MHINNEVPSAGIQCIKKKIFSELGFRAHISDLIAMLTSMAATGRATAIAVMGKARQSLEEAMATPGIDLD